MGIYNNFAEEIEYSKESQKEFLRNSIISLDTNFLLDIYNLDNSWKEAIKLLQEVEDNIFIPHQVMREFWRRRDRVIYNIQEVTDLPVEHIINTIRSEFKKRNLDSKLNEDDERVMDEIESHLNSIKEIFKNNRDSPNFNKFEMISDKSTDPILSQLQIILENSVGDPFEDEENYFTIAKERAEKKIPPGFEDWDSKKDKHPEGGAGDYFMWQQTLDFVKLSQNESPVFFIVTSETKRDWKVSIGNKPNIIQKTRPDLIKEGIIETEKTLIVINSTEFYKLLASSSSQSIDADRLVNRSQKLSNISIEKDTWTIDGYSLLLDQLKKNGYEDQYKVIIEASKNKTGFISRQEIYEIVDFAESDRSLRKFSSPVNRLSERLVEEGIISEMCEPALNAEYEGPGKTIGYKIPLEFTHYYPEYIKDSSNSLSEYNLAFYPTTKASRENIQRLRREEFLESINPDNIDNDTV